MIDTRTAVDRAFRLAAYLASLVLMSALAIWCAIAVGGRAMTMIDQAIIDASGPLVSDRDNRRMAALALVAVPPPAADIRASTTPAPLQAAAVRRPLTEITDDDAAANYHSGSDDTYRTYCVRLCDGYFWPVSFSTTTDRFARDQATCASSCNSPAKLFVHKMPGGGPSTMSTPDGLPYVALKTAFMFRTSYDAQCKCQPQPWEQQAMDRHRLHAAAEAARKGDRVASAAVRELTAKVDANRQQAAKSLLVATERADKELAALAKLAGTRAIVSAHAEARRKSDEARTIRFTDVRRDGIMGLGAQPAPGSKSSWIPASGSNRTWKEKVFNGN